MELASVICCTCGRLHTLNEAVKSFLDQDYENKEMIIINDHEGYPLELAEPYPNIRIYNYDRRFPSLAAKRNAAKELANGNYILIWEDDDLSTPWRISSSVKFLQDNPEFDGVNSDTALKSCNNEGYDVIANNYEGATCFRSSFLSKHQYNESLNVTMDLDMQSHCNLKRFDPSPLYWYLYRWGLGVWHLSGRGADDSSDNWEQGRVHARTDLGNVITPAYTKHHWLDASMCLSQKLNKEDFEIWFEAIKKYL